MRLSNNFEWEEFVNSDTARARGIANVPDTKARQAIAELVETILQPLREAWGRPLKVTSGYRCEELNRAVGGSATSAHLGGYAADIQTQDMETFFVFAEAWLKNHNIAFDQSIREMSKTAVWWHIAVRNLQGMQRRQFKALEV